MNEVQLAKRALRLSCQFILENAEQFSLKHAKTADDRMMLLKPFGELMLVMSLLRRWGFTENLPLALAENAWEELNRGEVVLEILLTRHDLGVVSALYAGFVDLGFTNARVQRIVEHIEQSRSSNGVELPQWRRLDVAHAFSRLGVRPFPTTPSEGTWLHLCPEPWTISEDIAYAVTHEIFYISDFGAAAERVPAHVAAYVETWLPAWLRIYQSQPHWDLFAELLMVRSSLGFDGKKWDSFYSALLSAQRSDGTFPTPPGAGRNLLIGVDSEPRIYFLQNYHTALVAVMALAMYLMRNEDRTTS